MKFAFISDIHANLPALEAVLNDVRSQHPDIIFCLGDLVNFAGWDNETIELIRSLNIIVIQGNHDEGIGNQKSIFPFSYKSMEQKKFGEDSIQFVNQNITPGNRKYLRGLPVAATFNFWYGDHKITITLVHGSPSSNLEYVHEEVSEDYLSGIMNTANCDILLMGHTHIPYHRILCCERENEKIYRHAINAGSVGKPKHGDNRACYAIVELGDNADLSNSYTIRVKHQFVVYDVEKVIKHIHEIGLSNAYDRFLREGNHL